MTNNIIKEKIKEIREKYTIIPGKDDKKIHFKMLAEIVQLRLGKIKEGEAYINTSTKMIFVDKLGNEFKMLPSKVKSGQWSPYESGSVYNNPNYHMEELEKIVLSKGGKIKVGQIYTKSSKKMTFIDKLGNDFDMTPNSIKSGYWSPYEAGNTRDPVYHIKELEDMILSKGGKIKEGEQYINNSTKMTFIDKLGNEFKMVPAAVKSGQWSPYESGAVFNNPDYHMKELEEIALSRNGKIKEGEYYINANTKMTFIDQLENEFEMSPTSIKSGRWSPYESGNVRNPEYHMKELEDIVLSRNGKIKEGEYYLGANTKMTFIDQLGTEFKMTPTSVKSGHWSPYEKNYSENVCRQIIEKIYNKEFPSSWDIIKRQGKRTLQLDGYNSDLKIAFEYQGMQHTTGWFHQDQTQQAKSLIQIQERDEEKKQICIENNILLLEINYYKNTKKIQDIIYQTINDVKKSYEINNKNIPDFINNLEVDQIKIDLSKISHLVIMQKQIEEIVLCNEGKIKEGEHYINSNTKMTFIDKLGNEFNMTPSAVKNGHWSPYESGTVRNDPEYHMTRLEEIALSKGGKIKEGEQYINNDTKMTFIDKLGNEFRMKPHNIKSGQWSSYESGYIFNNPEYHMKELKEIVLSKGGKIKEGEYYINNDTKMTFIDKLNNEFEMLPRHIKSGHWSPYESGTVRDSNYHMKQLHEIVAKKMGKIKEGEVYINAKTKMTFIDELGNEFKMNPNNLKNGQWSPHKTKKY